MDLIVDAVTTHSCEVVAIAPNDVDQIPRGESFSSLQLDEWQSCRYTSEISEETDEHEIRRSVRSIHIQISSIYDYIISIKKNKRRHVTHISDKCVVDVTSFWYLSVLSLKTWSLKRKRID